MNEPRTERLVSFVILGLILAIVIVIILLAWVPPISKDELTHHLLVPKLYLKNGSIYELPSIKFSYYPMNIDLLYLIPLYLDNDILPKYLHFAFAIFTAMLLLHYLKKRLGIAWGLGGFFFFLTLPIIIKLSIVAYVDLGLLFFSTAALLLVLKWVKRAWQWKYLTAAGVSCGLALGTKYNGLIVFFLLTLLIAFLYSIVNRQYKGNPAGGHIIDHNATHERLRLFLHGWPKNSNLKAIGYAGIFVIISIIIFSPWLLRNYRWTKNPIYPLYGSIFQEKNKTVVTKLKQAATRRVDHSGLNHFLKRRLIYHENGWQTALVPFRIFFQGKDGDPQFFDGKLSPLLLILSFFAFIQIRHDSYYLKVEKFTLLFFSFLFVVIAFLSIDMRIRYILPIIPPLIILSIFGLKTLIDIFSSNLQRFSQLAIISFLILCAGYHLVATTLYVQAQFSTLKPFDYISGKVSRDAYISRHRKEYPVIKFANANLSVNSKILALFAGNRGYYSDREMIHSVGTFDRTIRRSTSNKTACHLFTLDGFSHLLIRYDLFNQWMHNTFKLKEMAVLKHFFEHHTKLVFGNENYGLYRLHDC